MFQIGGGGHEPADSPPKSVTANVTTFCWRKEGEVEGGGGGGEEDLEEDRVRRVRKEEKEKEVDKI